LPPGRDDTWPIGAQMEPTPAPRPSGEIILPQPSRLSRRLALLLGGGALAALAFFGWVLWLVVGSGHPSSPTRPTQLDPTTRAITVALGDLGTPALRAAAVEKLLLYAERPEALDGILVGMTMEDPLRGRARTALALYGPRMMPQLIEASEKGRFTPELLADLRELLFPTAPKWHLVGPFPIPEGKEALDVVEFSKQPDLATRYVGALKKDVGWREVPTEAEGRINLGQVFKSAERWCIYGYTALEAAEDGEATLTYRVDDQLTFWVNGEKVPAPKGGSGKITAKLRKGTNVFVLRVDNSGGGGWWFGLQVQRPIPEALRGPPLLCLFEDNSWLLGHFKEGAGHASLEASDCYTGPYCLRVTPDQKVALPGGNWRFPIMETPNAGEYRYLRFAWKKRGGSKCVIQLHGDPGGWEHRYHAGAEGWGKGVQVAKESPAEWQVHTVDLLKDFGGAWTLNGLAISPMDGEYMLLDHVYLGRSLADFQKLPARTGAVAQKP
jgi:hypothetical protein